MPPTTKEKYIVYLTVDDTIEMYLYDGKNVYTPDFPSIPVVNIQLKDGRVIKQVALQRMFRRMMKTQEVTYNKTYDIWEALG